MNPITPFKGFSPLRVRVPLILVLLLSTCFFIGGGIGSTSSKSQTSLHESVNVPPGQEKKLDNQNSSAPAN